MGLDSSHKARKRFGQNFLVDDGIIYSIIRAIAPTNSDIIVEIGPGQGALTEPLLAASEHLQVVEIDRDLVQILRTKFQSHGGFQIHQGDALQFDFSTLTGPESDGKLRIVGNLPYNISTPLIFHLLSFHNTVEDMHFMLQKEVVERMAADPSTKHYGRLSIMTQYWCQVEPLFPVPPESFSPQPKVDSAIVRLRPHKTLPQQAKNIKMLDGLVKTAFQQRRKTLRNALKTYIQGTDALLDLGIKETLRPENLSINMYVDLANYLAEHTQLDK